MYSQHCFHATHPVTLVPTIHAQLLMFPRYTTSYCCSHATHCHVIPSTRFFPVSSNTAVSSFSILLSPPAFRCNYREHLFKSCSSTKRSATYWQFLWLCRWQHCGISRLPTVLLQRHCGTSRNNALITSHTITTFWITWYPNAVWNYAAEVTLARLSVEL
jgi:hypothetical protein